MGLSGAWRRQAVTRAAGGAPYYSTDATTHPPGALPVDPVHSTADVDGRTGTPYANTAPAGVGPVPDGLTDDTAWPAGTGPGDMVDRTPTSHSDGLGVGGGQSDAQAIAEANAHRAEDLGTARIRHRQQPVMRGAEERYTTEARDGLVLYAGSRAALTTQSKGLPENNPDGIRPGLRVMRWVDRKIKPSHARKHDERPLRPATAAAPNASPSPGSVLTSPFDWLASARSRVAMSPMVPRSPRPWDETALTDGTDQAPADASADYWRW